MSLDEMNRIIIIKDPWIESHPEIRTEIRTRQRNEKSDLQKREFEHRVKAEYEKQACSIEWYRKKRERDALKVVDMTPWIPKDLTQKEIDDYCIRHPDSLQSINNTFKTQCQRVQVLRECVILAREAGNDLKRWYKASLKKHLGLNKDEIKKIIKDIECRNPEFFMI